MQKKEKSHTFKNDDERERAKSECFAVSVLEVIRGVFFVFSFCKE